MHALIIEDEHFIAMAIEDVLRQCGFTSVEFAVSSQAAIDSASRRCPDLITSDVRLDPGCGIETVQEICSKAEIPVIFITGNGADVTRRLPNHQLLDKPFSGEDLTAAVLKALSNTELS